MVKNTVDFCMLCGAVPCECSKKPDKKSTTRRTVKSVTLPPPPVSAAPKIVKARPNLSVIRAVKSADELEMEQAISVLAAADMLHYQHLIEYRQIIDLPAHRIDAMIWRQRAAPPR